MCRSLLLDLLIVGTFLKRSLVKISKDDVEKVKEYSAELRSPMFPVLYAIYMDPAPEVRHAYLSREYCSVSWEELVAAGIFQLKRGKDYVFDVCFRVVCVVLML